jgi:hypothetical protein
VSPQDHDASQTSNAAQTSSAARRGRAAGVILFWCLAVYVVGMSSWSIIPSLYFPSLVEAPKAIGAEACMAELEALEEELSEESARALASREVRSPERWLGEWDRRMAGLHGQCGPLETARKDLETAREVVGSMLERYADDAAPAQRKTRASLDALRRAPHQLRPPHRTPPHG